MKNILLYTFIFLLSQNSFAQNDKTEILVLGTIHLFNIKDDSITSPQKQLELKQILANLKDFNPQQIFVEQPPENDDYFLKIQEEISASKKETKETGMINNEVYQVGIKLAEMLKLPKGVQGIDWTSPDTSDSTIIYKTNYEKAYVNFIRELQVYARAKKTGPEDKEGLKMLEDIMRDLIPYFQLNTKISLNQMYKTFNQPDNLKNSTMQTDLVVS
jgi:hypothetical protein